jgi:energy-coupling factor transporter transmembrane protein EcfT
MDAIILIILFFLICGLILGIPIGLSIFSYKWLKKYGHKKFAVFVPTLIMGLLIYSIYYVIYPPDSFYVREFEYNTNLKFPKSGKIVYKDSNYPDHFGDYWAAAVIKVDEKDYVKLKADISKPSDFQIDTTVQKIGIAKEYDVLTKDIKESDLDIVFYNTKKEWFKVAFLRDKRTIIFERSST